MTETTDLAAEVAAWNTTNKAGTLIQWRRKPGTEFTNTDTTWTPAYLLAGVPTVRVTSGNFVHLADVRIHPATEYLAACDKVTVPELDFQPPACALCSVPTECDGDGFVCRQCRASWASDGVTGRRQCVECLHGAAVLCEDRQPRCLPCAAGVLAKELDPTAPYPCRRCKVEVIGIGPEHGDIYGLRLCGWCNDAEGREADLARWRDEATPDAGLSR